METTKLPSVLARWSRCARRFEKVVPLIRDNRAAVRRINSDLRAKILLLGHKFWLALTLMTTLNVSGQAGDISH